MFLPSQQQAPQQFPVRVFRHRREHRRCRIRLPQPHQWRPHQARPGTVTAQRAAVHVGAARRQVRADDRQRMRDEVPAPGPHRLQRVGTKRPRRGRLALGVQCDRHAAARHVAHRPDVVARAQHQRDRRHRGGLRHAEHTAGDVLLRQCRAQRLVGDQVAGEVVEGEHRRCLHKRRQQQLRALLLRGRERAGRGHRRPRKRGDHAAQVALAGGDLRRAHVKHRRQRQRRPDRGRQHRRQRRRLVVRLGKTELRQQPEQFLQRRPGLGGRRRGRHREVPRREGAKHAAGTVETCRRHEAAVLAQVWLPGDATQHRQVRVAGGVVEHRDVPRRRVADHVLPAAGVVALPGHAGRQRTDDRVHRDGPDAHLLRPRVSMHRDDEAAALVVLAVAGQLALRGVDDPMQFTRRHPDRRLVPGLARRHAEELQQRADALAGAVRVMALEPAQRVQGTGLEVSRTVIDLAGVLLHPRARHLVASIAERVLVQPPGPKRLQHLVLGVAREVDVVSRGMRVDHFAQAAKVATAASRRRLRQFQPELETESLHDLLEAVAPLGMPFHKPARRRRLVLAVDAARQPPDPCRRPLGTGVAQSRAHQGLLQRLQPLQVAAGLVEEIACLVVARAGLDQVARRANLQAFPRRRLRADVVEHQPEGPVELHLAAAIHPVHRRVRRQREVPVQLRVTEVERGRPGPAGRPAGALVDRPANADDDGTFLPLQLAEDRRHERGVVEALEGLGGFGGLRRCGQGKCRIHLDPLGQRAAMAWRRRSCNRGARR